LLQHRQGGLAAGQLALDQQNGRIRCSAGCNLCLGYVALLSNARDKFACGADLRCIAGAATVSIGVAAFFDFASTQTGDPRFS
jgi:hypothetical protein